MEIFKSRVNWPRPGKYVVAVSGGVDSMSLLHILVEAEQNYELIVAHCNHGIRPDSDEDEELVRVTAGSYGLEFVMAKLRLGKGAGEAEARYERYQFLHTKRQESGAAAVVTAHHLDDRIETMLLNKQRGAGWYGLSPLHETDTVKRPLLEVSKSEIITYANEYGLKWREDETNTDSSYTPRNYLRHNVDREATLKELREHDERRHKRLTEIMPVFDKVVSDCNDGTLIYRAGLLEVGSAVSRDVLYFALRRYSDMLDIDMDAVYRLEHFCKTSRPGKRLILSGSVTAAASTGHIELRVN